MDVIYLYRQTEEVFRKYEAAAGVCLCCQALFEPLIDLAGKYGLDLAQLLADLETVATKGEI